MMALTVQEQRREMLTFERIAAKPVVFQMLTALSLQAFLDLLPAFHHATAHIEHQAERHGKQPRQRQKGVVASRCAPMLIACCSSCSTSGYIHSELCKASSLI
jgi:hypothetical protein